MKMTTPREAFLWGCAFGLVLVTFLHLISGCAPQPDMDTSTEQGRQRAIALSPSYQPPVATSTPTETVQQRWERRVRERIPCEDGEAQTKWPSKVVYYFCPTYHITRDGPKTRDPWSNNVTTEVVF